MNTTHSTAPTYRAPERKSAPAGMVEVSRDEFYALLRADLRDIMPTVDDRLNCWWKVVSTRAVWGWDSVGYASPWGEPQVWAVVASAIRR